MDKTAMDIRTVRSQLVDKGLVFFVLVMPAAMLLSISRSFEHGWHPIFLFQIVMTGVLITSAIFRKRLPYGVKVCLLLGVLFAIGTAGVWTFGIVTSGYIVLFSFSVMAAITFGTRAGLLACAVCIGVIIIAGIAVCTGTITFPFNIVEYATSVTAWTLVTSTFFLFAPVTIIAFGVVYKHLEASFRDLRESEENYRQLIENMPSVAWRTSEQGKTTFISPNIEKIYGFSQKEIYEGGDSVWFERIHPEDVEIVRTSFEMMFAKKQKFDVEYRIRRKDGVWIWLHDLGISAFEKENIQYAYGIFSDITERKQAEKALIANEQKYRTLFDSANDTIFLMENERFIDCNPRAFEMFGATRDQIIGQTPYRFSPKKQPDGRESKQSALEKTNAVMGGEPLFFEWKHCRYDGTLFDAEVSLTDMNVEGSKYLLAIVRDITQRKEDEKEKKEIQKQLQQAQRMESIGTLASGIAHDFNNILSSILGFSELVKYDLPEQDHESRGNIESVIKAGLRAKDLVQHILTFSRSSESVKGPVMPSLLIKEVVKFLKASLPAAIETRVQINDAGLAVFGEATQIHQVIMNLCVNAAHAMKAEGGRLDIRLEKVTLAKGDMPGYEEMEPGDHIKITVSDSGHGIPKDIVDRIFDPFFTTKARGEGTGMGLSVVHGIVKEMQGDIQVESEPAKGTAFHIMLPVYEGEPEPETSFHSQKLQKGEGRILFVDDEKPILTMASRMMQKLGYKVTTMPGSFEALELFVSDPDAFDLVMTDLNMPKMNGIELSRRIQGKAPGIPIILCTGFSEYIDRQILDDVGIHHVMMKPAIYSELASVVKTVLERK